MNKENVIRYIERLEWEAGQSDKFFIERNELYIENQKLKKENEKLNHYKLLYQKVKERNDKAIEYVENYNVFKEFSFPLMKRDEENQVKSSIDYGFQTSIKKSLLEILKGNNVESEK